jgi:hypothetical protein
LFGTAGSIGLRIEIQKNVFALEIGQRELLAALIRQRKGRGFVSNTQLGHLSSFPIGFAKEQTPAFA